MFPQAGAEAAEDMVARETRGMSLRDEGQRGLVRALSHAARAGTQVRRKVSERRPTQDTHFNRGLQLFCFEQTGDGSREKERDELTGSCSKAWAKVMVVCTEDQHERRDLVKSQTHIHMLGKTEGKRRRGQQRMRWLDSITDSVDTNQQIPRDSERRGSLECCSPWSQKELDLTP